MLELLKKMILMERELSKLKFQLTDIPEFNLLDAFSLFDTNSQQKLS